MLVEDATIKIDVPLFQPFLLELTPLFLCFHLVLCHAGLRKRQPLLPAVLSDPAIRTQHSNQSVTRKVSQKQMKLHLIVVSAARPVVEAERFGDGLELRELPAPPRCRRPRCLTVASLS